MSAEKRPFVALLCMIILVTASAARPQTSSGCYSDLPPALSREVDKAVISILQNDERAVVASMPRLVAFTVADVVAAKEIRDLNDYQYYGDVLRTDQQVGASSSSSGTTSAVEKPGLVQLLGFAIERGAIQQSINDSTVTLTTSPYALVALVKQNDSPETYQHSPVLNRISVSATFNITDANNVSGSFSRKQLTEWSAKLRLSGDKSTRSAAFQRLWMEKLGKLEQQRLDLIGEMESKLFNISSITDRFEVGKDLDVVSALLSKIRMFLQANHITPAPAQMTFPESQTKPIREMILCTLFNNVHEPVKNGTIKVDEAALASELNRLTTIQQAIADARVQFKKDVKHFLRRGTQSTLEYTNHRVAGGSDYSEAKLLFAHHAGGIDAMLNAGVSIYNDPDPAKNQEKIRDFLISGSLEWVSNSNPLFRGDKELATPITFSVNGRYQRLKENENMTMRDPDIGSFQARLEIPVAPGFSIPIAYTYSTATELLSKPENRFNVGLHLNVDKLFNFMKATKGQ